MGNNGEGDGAYPYDKLESDDDEPLHVTKHRLEEEEEAEDNTPMPPQSPSRAKNLQCPWRPCLKGNRRKASTLKLT